MLTFNLREIKFLHHEGPSSAPTPRVRGYKKSRRGCAACKRRKVKCDETHPVCYNCSIYYKDVQSCEWPDSKPATEQSTKSASSRKAAVISSNEAPITSSIARWDGKLTRKLETIHSMSRDVGAGSIDPFESYPATPIPNVQRLLHHYITVAAWEYYPLPPRKSENTAWPSLGSTDALLFHSNLQVSVRSLERLQGFKNSVYADLVARECIRLLRQRVQDPEQGTSDQTIGAVAQMMEVEHDKGNSKTVQMHLEGLRSMIKLRGGFEALRHSSPLILTAVVWRTLLVTFECPYPPTPADKIEQPIWLQDALSKAVDLDFPTHLDLGIDEVTWEGLVAIKVHSQHLERTLKEGKELDINATEVLASLEWQRWHCLPIDPKVGPIVARISRCTRTAATMFLCMLNFNGTAFLAGHPTGALTYNSIVYELRASLEAVVRSQSKTNLMLLWLLLMGALASLTMPERQWFINELLAQVTELEIMSWAGLKAYTKKIMFVDIFHDRLGEKVWDDVMSKKQELEEQLVCLD